MNVTTILNLKETTNMELTLKLSINQKQDIKGLDAWYEELLKKDKIQCKISTKKLDIERDQKDNRNIKSLKKVEITIALKEGFLLLKGNLSISFRQPFGGEFYIIDYKEIPNGSFVTQGGVALNIKFDNNYPISIDQMFWYLNEISNHKDFVFNIGQFDEFMEVFSFYKKLSDEINNNATFKILKSTKPYYNLDVQVKELYDKEGILSETYSDLEKLYDQEGIIKGYKIPTYIYERFNNQLKDKAIQLVDLTISNQEGVLRKIQRMKENLYLSDYQVINDHNAKNIQDVELINIAKDKENIILSILLNQEVKETFINIYDMGQKIKIDSIDESLKLINRGTTEASMTMIEYLIGDKQILSTSERVLNNKVFISNRIYGNPTYISYMKELNESQKIAFLKAVDGSPITLIKGPPGTGKTHVINAITQYISKELNEKVIISSQTHVAIDNVLDKLMENKELIVPNRITNRKNKYSMEEIDKTLFKTWGSKLKSNLEQYDDKIFINNIIMKLNNFKGVEEIQYSKNMSNEFSVIGATTTTTAISGKRGLEVLKGYNWLIIDEVSKSPITEVLRYLPYVDKIILVGDDFQLSPLLEFSKDEVKNLPSYNDDMFDKLETIYEQSVFSKTIRKARESGRLVLLDENYRSLNSVLETYNIFYDGKLKNKRESINPNVVQFKEHSILNNDSNVFFVEVLGSNEQEDSKSHSRFNVQEAMATSIVLENIIKTLESPHLVTVSAIFPYAAQISYFTKTYKELINKAKMTFKSFEIDTVDAFQGRETDIVLVNTVVTRPEKRNFLRDFRRINVSMSRARDKLIVFGSRTLEKMEMENPDGGIQQYFKSIIDSIRKYGRMIQIDQEGKVKDHDRQHQSKFA